jgi:hypothetical protein
MPWFTNLREELKMSEQDHHGSSGENGEGLPLEVAKLLCLRLCHNVVSPASTISNGMELLSGEDTGEQSEVMDPITNSGHEVAAS